MTFEEQAHDVDRRGDERVGEWDPTHQRWVRWIEGIRDELMAEVRGYYGDDEFGGMPSWGVESVLRDRLAEITPPASAQ